MKKIKLSDQISKNVKLANGKVTINLQMSSLVNANGKIKVNSLETDLIVFYALQDPRTTRRWYWIKLLR